MQFDSWVFIFSEGNKKSFVKIAQKHGGRSNMWTVQAVTMWGDIVFQVVNTETGTRGAFFTNEEDAEQWCKWNNKQL